VSSLANLTQLKEQVQEARQRVEEK